jgi:hypothetical protein
MFRSFKARAFFPVFEACELGQCGIERSIRVELC